MVLFKDVAFPELHSISPSDGDATESRSVLSLSTKQKTLGTKCNRAHRKARKKKKQKNKGLLQIINILWLKTKRKTFF